MIDSFIKDEKENNKLYNAIENYPAIKEKAEWALRWIDNDSSTFSERIFAFACVEGIFCIWGHSFRSRLLWIS